MPDIQKMSVVERVALGKKKIKNVVDRIIELMALAEQNDIIVHSKTLSSQIPRSYAANAFKVFQNSLHRQEIVLLCSFWDKPDASLAHNSIPLVCALIDNPAVIHALVEEARAWSKDAENAGSELRRLIKLVAETQDSELFDAVKNIRDKYLAHALEFTRAEGRKAIRPMKYGDERKMLEITMDVVENLYIWITGTHFDLADNKRMHGRYARELWENCHFDIKSR